MTKPVNNNLTNWQVADGFEGRVREAFDGAALAEIAAKLGENYHTLRNYLKLKRDPPPRLFVAIAETTNYSPYWLLTNKGPKLVEGDFSAPLFKLSSPEAIVLSLQEKQLIRDEVMSVLRELLLSQKDRAVTDSFLVSLEKMIKKEDKER